MQGTIAVEEHFLPAGEHLRPGAVADSAERELVEARLRDTGQRRLAEMDRCGIERAVLSLTSPGIQDELDREQAVARAVAANDALADIVAAAPGRYAGLAALPLQDPESACTELERAVRGLGLKGVLVNGYSVSKRDGSVYYDGPGYDAFWELLVELDAPFYLHPRNPPPDQRRIYEGREELLGSPWAFTVETATHALRFVTSGLFDRFPGLTIVLGHLGELLPFALDRTQRRLAHNPAVSLAKPLVHYLRDNFFIATSGNFHTVSLLACIEQIGVDRIMFGVDYPYEEMQEAAAWLDSVPLDDVAQRQIGRTNAERLFKLE